MPDDRTRLPRFRLRQVVQFDDEPPDARWRIHEIHERFVRDGLTVRTYRLVQVGPHHPPEQR